MPIYEFYSPDTNKIYSFFARSLSYHGKVPKCPDGPKFRMQKQVSRFAITGRAKEESDDPLGDIDDSQMDALMADMEQDMPELDKDNPDPRTLGRFMRKMSDLMGDKAPPALKEMIKRLESGEDPEKLDEEFGDIGEDGEDPFLAAAVKKLRQGAKNHPIRDPQLYEFTDYWKGK